MLLEFQESSRRKTLQQGEAIESLLRRFEALQRSLKASEATSELWRQIAEMAGSLLLEERSLRDCDENDVSYIVNGGWIDFMLHDDSQKWKLLGDGPRRETPDWMTRRIRTICPQFPPRKTNVSEQINGDALLLRKQEVRSRLTAPLALLCPSISQKDQGGTILYGSIIRAAVGEQGLRSPVWASRL
ncbi:alpha-amylase [Sarracenia purpurea var. burkii]